MYFNISKQNFKGTNLSVCFSTNQAPSDKESTLKGKNLLLMGANSFFLEQAPFQKEGNTILTIVSSESVSVPL